MIVNLTQHAATEEQKTYGVFDITGVAGTAAKAALTFDVLPGRQDIEAAAAALATIALQSDASSAMIGGAPFLMPALERALKEAGIRPVYAFSRRESVDEMQADGSVRKTAVFRHSGFVEA